MRTIGTLCDAWWDDLDQEKKNSVWILMQMVREMKVGTRIEFRRGPEQFEAAIIEPAQTLNTSRK